MRVSRVVTVAVLVLSVTAACATRTAPPLPAALAYPEFIYPVVPAGTGVPEDAAAVDRGWRFMQNGDLANAEREFSSVLRRTPGAASAGAGSAYVTLARDDFEQAVRAFDTVVARSPTYVPALVGRGQALLELKRDAEALQSFEAALAVDASLSDLRQRVDVLRFRGLQALIESARAAATAGRLDEAATAYGRAIAAAPESGFLHRELAAIERTRGNVDAALTELRRAVDIDPVDAMAHVQIGQLLESRQDFAGAEASYRRAVELDPTPELKARLAVVAERAREARLPAEFHALASAVRLTRGDLAALLGVRLDEVLRAAAPRDVVMTDVTGHWAASWITQVARAGFVEPYPNHTFQPREAITRGDLAAAVSRAVTLLSPSRSALRDVLAARPTIADMASGHLSYPAAAVAVASGVMPLDEGGRFDVSRAVSGADAADVIARLRALAASR